LITFVQGYRQKNFQGGRGATEKKTKKLQKRPKNIALLSLYQGGRGGQQKKIPKIVLLSLYLLYLYHVSKSRPPVADAHAFAQIRFNFAQISPQYCHFAKNLNQIFLNLINFAKKFLLGDATASLVPPTPTALAYYGRNLEVCNKFVGSKSATYRQEENYLHNC